MWFSPSFQMILPVYLPQEFEIVCGVKDFEAYEVDEII